MKIAVVVGTNRKGSLSRILADQVVAHHQALGAEVDCLDPAEFMGPEFLLPTAYKEPEATVSEAVQRFLACDGAVFVVPEYNGSYPGVLKLFVDMLPYPEGFDKRPCAFIGLAAGRFASLRAVEHFQQVVGYRNAYSFPQRIFISDSFKQFGADGLVDDELKCRLETQAKEFQTFITQVSPA